jgi:hypothetical protein
MKEKLKSFVVIFSKKASRLADALLEKTMPVSRRHKSAPKKKSKKGKK